jgi:exodeoxyribonuclease VII small subunit
MTTGRFEFEKALKELEQITTWFESTDVDLDQGIAKFERGMELASALKAHLATIENRVEKIKERFGDGKSTETTQTPASPDSDADQPDLFEG